MTMQHTSPQYSSVNREGAPWSIFIAVLILIAAFIGIRQVVGDGIAIDSNARIVAQPPPARTSAQTPAQTPAQAPAETPSPSQTVRPPAQ